MSQVKLATGEIAREFTGALEFAEEAREVDLALALCALTTSVELPQGVKKAMVMERVFEVGLEPVCPAYGARARRAILERLAYLQTNGLIDLTAPRLITDAGEARYEEVVLSPPMPTT